jgi:hypothetical protein
MVFGGSLTKAGRLVELQRAFWKSPGRVLSTEELANRIDVAPRTVRKYLQELSGSGSLPIYREGRGWKLAEDARMEILPYLSPSLRWSARVCQNTMAAGRKRPAYNTYTIENKVFNVVASFRARTRNLMRSREPGTT